jgi:Multiubiquitin
MSPTDPNAHPRDAEQRRPHPVTIHINDRPVRLPDHVATGLQIKQAAIDLGSPIRADFVLTEEIGPHRTRVIGDDDEVRLNKRSRFLANDGDDNS